MFVLAVLRNHGGIHALVRGVMKVWVLHCAGAVSRVGETARTGVWCRVIGSSRTGN